MGKAVLTFEDKPDGSMHVSIELDPPVKRGETGVCGARAIGLELMNHVASENLGQSFSEAMDIESSETI